MTSATHSLFGLAMGSLVVPRVHARAYLVIGALCAILPDVDLLAPYFGGDRDFHRRFTHSVFFAGLLGIACGFAASHSRFQGTSVRLGTLAALCSLSHGVLDMVTSYPMGVAMMSPFSAHRYVLPWRPIESLTTEALWVAVPVLLVLAGVLWLRRVQILSFTRERPISFSLHERSSG